MRTHPTARTRRQQFGWLTICAIISILAMIGLAPGNAGAHAPAQAWQPASLSSALRPASTPVSDSPALTLAPPSGPVGTRVKLQGTGWPADGQLLIKYDDVSTCNNANLTELSPDPNPTANAAGAFSITFAWPAVSSAQMWYACVVTSDGTLTDDTPFQVLSLNVPSISLSAKGAFMPGQTFSVQGQNWFPGGLLITFALQRSRSTFSLPLEEYTASLLNGTLLPVTITIPADVSPGSYTLVATAEQQALQGQSSAFTIQATPTPTPTPMPSPSPTPTNTPDPTPVIVHHQTPPPTPRQLSGGLLALVIISGSMALCFVLIGAAILTYLLRSRSNRLAAFAIGPTDPSDQQTGD